MLYEQNKWRLSHNQCSVNEDLINIVRKNPKPKSIDESFIELFAQKKFEFNSITISMATINNYSFLSRILSKVFN